MNGELADMACAAHASFFGDGGNAKSSERFRINALLALEPFGPGNYLAAITSETTFEFKELEEKPTSLYILIDYANSEVLAQFSGLMQWMADFIDACNYARRLKALGGLTPYEFICKCRTAEPESFNLDPIHQMPGLNS